MQIVFNSGFIFYGTDRVIEEDIFKQWLDTPAKVGGDDWCVSSLNYSSVSLQEIMVGLLNRTELFLISFEFTVRL